MNNIAANMTRAVIGTGIESAITGQKMTCKTVLNAGLQAGIETGAAHAAHGIGGMQEGTDVAKHAAHAGAAALAKGASNLVTGDPFEKNIAAAGFGTVVGKMIAQGLTD